MQSIRNLFSRQPNREARVIHVQLSDDGFAVTKDSGDAESTTWSEIERIYTYKVDCWAYDMIWLAFERQGRVELHIPEDAEGFDSLRAAVNDSFPDLNSEWYFGVMQPPFAENLTVLFRRKTDA
jgi:hypothetical protein